MSVTARFSDPDDALRHLRALATTALREAVGLATDTIAVDSIEVEFVADPQATIPEWGVGGCTEGPHEVRVALDPATTPEEASLVATLLHEFHHAMRWRVVLLDGNLADMLVSEGLAVHFEAAMLATPFYAKLELRDEWIRAAAAHLHESPCDAKRWFYGAGPMPPGFGYTLGYRICTKYGERTGAALDELLVAPTDEVIGALDDLFPG